MWDRKLKQLKGGVLEACVVPAYVYELGTQKRWVEREEEDQHYGRLIVQAKVPSYVSSPWDCSKHFTLHPSG